MPMIVPNFNKLQLVDGSERGTGWKPRYPDLRDYTEESPQIAEHVVKLGFKAEAPLPKAVDKSEHFPPVKDQLNIGSCTANAASNIIEYYQSRAFGKYIPSSRLFIYKTTRNLQRDIGDVGAYLRTTMAAIALFGTPPEEYHPYKTVDYDKEPNSFLYSMADNYEATYYFCLDPVGINETKDVVLNRIKKFINVGIPSMFGFYIFSSFERGRQAGSPEGNEGYIPFPGNTEEVQGGHAIVIAGYNDELVIINDATGEPTVGAFKILNCWGTSWGFNGYGWLPYKYVETGLACDFWSIISMRWLDTGKFGL